MFTMTEKDIRRFQKYCVFDENMILRWGGSLNQHGYGKFKLNGKSEYAHRIAYFLWGDEDLHPEDHVLHKNCVVGKENRNIIDARYLYIGDHNQNMRDMAEAGSLKGVIAGENNPKNKLTAAQVLEVYRRVWAGERPRDLAIEFNVAEVTITHVKQGWTWRHLTGHARDAA